MIKGCATAEGTATYASRFDDLPGNYRPMLGLSVSSIGLGTYLGESDDATDAAYADAIGKALREGINLLDTAVNYRSQRSERVIGKVIAELINAGELKREQIVIATKGGYLPFEDGEDPRAWFEQKLLRPGIVAMSDVVQGSHCMTPRYLDAMIEMSRANLGLETIDLYYLHNPESQLAAVSRDDFHRRIRDAFEFLELAVNEGRISYYGTATWNGYRVAASDRSYLSLAEMVAAANEVAGADHHFRVIQLPYNLGMPEALTLSNQTLADGAKASTLAAADANGVAVCGSASLLQGRLTHGLPELLGAAMSGLDSDAQRSIQFARSTPGINVALVGMSSVAHVDHNLAAARRPPASFEALMKLFQRS